ncbi:uncharacterized protein MELLADRAFT_57880 [Melampsora larici-populina 98AG31]|uniref:Uncharacterized protein n=1 Tax=Melampsora larici-populina (strain 98AG31 / pathotype 3-4-7) TaxID=747676 RepID=F4S7L1_MELLP|nr:uncharacterized protein MELLADRAFT_57880 [Melampsora larici-populina 98AG31]EGF99373.1 hypothetical protein MELLADRAFT_57880 [Melampsora larici-populina 98AG31]
MCPLIPHFDPIWINQTLDANCFKTVKDNCDPTRTKNANIEYLRIFLLGTQSI